MTHTTKALHSGPLSLTIEESVALAIEAIVTLATKTIVTDPAFTLG